MLPWAKRGLKAQSEGEKDTSYQGAFFRNLMSMNDSRQCVKRAGIKLEVYFPIKLTKLSILSNEV